MRISKNSKLFSQPIAHRGLWGGDIIENSLSAYKNAVENGFPIEIDLYSSTDGVLYCFHDDTLIRMTGKSGKIFEKDSNYISSLTLLNSQEKIPTFDEVLSLCENKVPLLIEIKNQPDTTIVEKVINRLNTYKGEFALQSFNPLYIKKVKKLAPHFIRGILSTKSSVELKNTKWYEKLVIKNMLLNFLIKPDFISSNYNDFPLKKSKTKNKAVLAWTVNSKEIYEKVKPYVDNVIFEGFNI